MQETGSLARNKFPKDNLVLIGMPGCGKSTIGVLLAKALNMRFIDTDLLIQDRTGHLLSQLIKEHGVDGFNAIENDLCSSIRPHRSVIATGGSVVYGKEAMENLTGVSCVLYLSCSYENLSARLRDLDQRGVVHRPGQTLLDLYQERVPLYQKYADITIQEPERGFDVALILAESIRGLREGGFL